MGERAPGARVLMLDRVLACVPLEEHVGRQVLAVAGEGFCSISHDYFASREELGDLIVFSFPQCALPLTSFPHPGSSQDSR